MKIRLLTQNPFSVAFGGGEYQAQKYIENIRKINDAIDIDFFSFTETEFDILHIVGIHSGINPYWIDVLKNKGVKIVVSSVFYLKPNYLFDFRRPIIYKVCSFIPHHIVNWMKQLLLKADIILPNSMDEKIQLKQVFGINEAKIKILYNGVDEKYFDNIDKELFKIKYNLNNYILCASYIEPRKNHLNLIHGFLKFKTHNKSDLKLVLLGDYRGNYFGYHNEVKKIISNNLDNIVFINNLNNSDILFKSAYLGAKAHFLLSSLETPGLSNIEAAYAGNKLVLGNCLPVREYFLDFANYINPYNLDEIAKSIENIINDEFDSSKQIDFINKYYTWEQISKTLLINYQDICNRT